MTSSNRPMVASALVAATVLGILSAFYPSPAVAQFACATVDESSDTAGMEVIVGEEYEFICGGFYCGYIGTGNSAVCVNGTTGYSLPNCDTSTSSADHLRLLTGSGDDTVYTYYAGSSLKAPLIFGMA